jgi:competence protein ComEC
MKQPLAAVAGLFAAGILLGSALSPPLPLLVAIAALAGLLTLRLRTDRATGWSLAALLVLAGWFHLLARTAAIAPDDLRRHFDATERLVVVRGDVVAAPEERWHVRHGRRTTNTLAVVAARAIGTSTDALRPVSGLLQVSTPSALDRSYPRGSEVELTGILRPPRGPSAPGLFDYAAYLRWRDIHFELRAPETGDWRLAPGATERPPAWEERFQSWARAVLARGLPETDLELELLWAMTLGWKAPLTDEVEEPFLRSGTMHIFAISGLHIVLIAGIAGAVLRFLFLPRLAVGLLVIPLCWLYTAATGWQASAIRATLMTTFVTGSWMLERPLNVLNSLAAAALAVLAWDPAQLFQPGFQLSFAVVAAIGALAPPLGSRLAALADVDPFLAPDAVPWWRRKLTELGRPLALNLAVSLGAWLGALPLGATYFHLITPASLLANLAVVPLGSLALGANLASLLCGDWAPALGELFNHSAWFWMHLILRVSRACARLPAGWWYTAPPPIAWITLAYLALMVFGLGLWRRPRLRRILLPLALVLLAIGAGQTVALRRQTRLVLLPLDGGHAVWLSGPPGRSLVDTGDAAAVDRITLPFLQAHGINRLPQLVLTHGDIRHVGGALGLASNLPVDQVTTSPIRFRSAIYRSVVDRFRAGAGAEPNDRFVVAARGARAGPWQVLHPADTDRFPRADDAGLVLALEPAPGHRALLLGDLGRPGQESLLQREPDLAADVVISGLPAQGEPLSDGLLDRLRPRWIVVADAAHPATAKAKPPLRQRLRRRAATVLFTSETGALDIRWTGREWTFRDALGKPLPPAPAPDESAGADARPDLEEP